MRTMKTLMLAGFAAVSLGVVTANAQSLVPSSGEGAWYNSQQQQTSPATINRGASVVPNQTVQYGSSDEGTVVPAFNTNLTAGGL